MELYMLYEYMCVCNNYKKYLQRCILLYTQYTTYSGEILCGVPCIVVAVNDNDDDI